MAMALKLQIIEGKQLLEVKNPVFCRVGAVFRILRHSYIRSASERGKM